MITMKEMLDEVGLPIWVLLVPIFNGAILLLWLLENLSCKLDPIIHWRSYRRAKQGVEPGGNRTTGWFYRIISDPCYIDIEGSRVQVHTGSTRTLPDGAIQHYGDFVQYDGCSYSPSRKTMYYHFKENDFGWMHEEEERLQGMFNNDTMVPVGDAPTDLEVLMSIRNEGMRM